MTGNLGINPTTNQENIRDGVFLLSRANGNQSIDEVKLAAVNDGATSYMAATVCGKQTVGSKAAFAMGTGATGVLTSGTITLSAGVQQGVYEAVCIVAGATATYELLAPNGVLVGIVKVGTAYSGNGLAFTLSNTTNSVVGDTFTITVGTAAFANVAGGTGNPTCSAITVDEGVMGSAAGVVGGTYTFTYIDATHFTGVDPFGVALPQGVDGTAYNAGGLVFTITAGGTASVAGDQFTITTYTGNDEWYPVSASAFDGTQNAAGILWSTTYVGGANPQSVAMVVRNCEVNDVDLCWPSTCTDDQQRTWIAQLEAQGIKKRTGIK